MRRVARFSVGVVAGFAVGCMEAPSAPAARDGPVADAKAPSARGTTSATSKPRFVPAPDEPHAVDAAVARAQQQADATGDRVVVYVGASWCEPCTRFHDAVEAGQLDTALAGVRFLEFDADRDRPRLGDAGYGSRLIPLIAIPGPTGRASPLRIEGGVKGDAAVDHIMKRLKPLLERTQPARPAAG